VADLSIAKAYWDLLLLVLAFGIVVCIFIAAIPEAINYFERKRKE